MRASQVRRAVVDALEAVDASGHLHGMAVGLREAPLPSGEGGALAHLSFVVELGATTVRDRRRGLCSARTAVDVFVIYELRVGDPSADLDGAHDFAELLAPVLGGAAETLAVESWTIPTAEEMGQALISFKCSILRDVEV